jgi:hypothetical protein
VAAPSAPSPAPAPGSTPLSAFGRLGRRGLLAIAVAGVVLAAGVVGSLVLFAPTAAAPPTFDQAQSKANASLAGYSGGGWALFFAVGLDQRSATTVPLTGLSNDTGGGCVPTGVDGRPVPSEVTVPAYSGSFAAGRAPFWFFGFQQAADGPYVIVTVAGGTATLLAGLSGAGCETNLSAVGTIPAPFVDSPVVAQAAWSGSAVNASAFVAADPGIDTLEMVAAGTSSYHGFPTPAGWLLQYAPCPPFGAPPLVSERTYVAGFGATGALLAASSSTTECPSS